MKLIKPSLEIIEQKPRDILIPADMEIGPKMWRTELLNTIYRQIEFAGRTCYKSHDKITEDSAKGFVERMVKSGHGSMLEHGTIYLTIPVTNWSYLHYSGEDCDLEFDHYPTHRCVNPYSKMKIINNLAYITTNYRVLVENNWLDDLKYLCEPAEHHEKRITVKFICSRGVWNEFIRHRTIDRTDTEEYYAITDYDPEKIFSFAQESQRYCNYSKDKYGNEVTFCIPSWLNIPEGNAYWHDGICYRVGANDSNSGISVNRILGDNWNEINIFIDSLNNAEKSYLDLIKLGWKPQQAREVLPNSVKTELIMTGYVSDWKHFLLLRTAESAHPSARELAIPLQEEFVKLGYYETSKEN